MIHKLAFGTLAVLAWFSTAYAVCVTTGLYQANREGRRQYPAYQRRLLRPVREVA